MTIDVTASCLLPVPVWQLSVQDCFPVCSLLIWLFCWDCHAILELSPRLVDSLETQVSVCMVQIIVMPTTVHWTGKLMCFCVSLCSFVSGTEGWWICAGGQPPLSHAGTGSRSGGTPVSCNLIIITTKCHLLLSKTYCSHHRHISYL